MGDAVAGGVGLVAMLVIAVLIGKGIGESAGALLGEYLNRRRTR